MFEYSILSLLCLFISCLILGFSKTSIGGLGILIVPIMVLGFGAKPSLGVFLPIIVFADFLSLYLYRGKVHWHAVFQLLPTTIFGLIIGYFIIDLVPNSVFTLLIGVVIILMLAISFYSDRFENLIKNKTYNSVLGVLVGTSSIIANSAGALVGMYFLQYKLEKKIFVGTRVHFFILLNSAKLPFIGSLGLITKETLLLDIFFIPVIFLGTWLGLKFINKIDMKLVKKIVQVSALISGIKLIHSGLTGI